MKKYNTFNKRFIHKHITELYKIKDEFEKSNNTDSDRYQDLLCDINDLILLYEDKNITTLYDTLDEDPYSTTLENNRLFFKDNEYSIPIIKEFDDIYQYSIEKLKLDEIDFNPYKDTAYTHKHLLHMINDFYNSIPDKEIKNIFNDVYKDRIYNVRFKESTASYCGGTTFDLKKYISINSTINFSCFRNLAHEYGHAIHDIYLGHTTSYKDTQYTELVSIFFELLASEYISNTNVILKDKERTQNIFNLIKMDNYARNLLVLNNTKDINFKDRDEAFNYYLKYLYEEEAYMAIDYDAKLFNDYLIPTIIDIELLWEYKKDPEKALYLLKDLIKNENENYIEHTKKLGLKLNSHEYDYIKHLVNK